MRAGVHAERELAPALQPVAARASAGPAPLLASPRVVAQRAQIGATFGAAFGAVVQRVLGEGDAKVFRQEVAAEFGDVLEERAQVAVDRIVQAATGLDDARARWGRAKVYFAPRRTRAPQGAAMPSIAGWVRPGETVAEAFHSGVHMDTDSFVIRGGQPHVIWTGGASICVAIGTFNGQLAWLKHATAIDLVADNVAQLAGEVAGKAKGNTVYLASLAMQQDVAQRFVAALQNKSLTVVQAVSDRLAIDADTGRVSTSFDETGLPVERTQRM